MACTGLETGTLCHEALAGASAPIDFLAALVTDGATRRDRLLQADALRTRSHVLLERLWRGLGGIAGVTRYGPPPEAPRTATLSFTIDGCDSTAVATALAEQGVFVSHRHFYAPDLARALGHGRGGFVRAGCAAYNTVEEVERLVDGVRRIAHH